MGNGGTRLAGAVAVALMIGAGCYVGGPGGTRADDAPPDTQTDGGEADADDSGDDDSSDGGAALPDDPALPTGWHRLSRAAYRNTVADLLTYTADADAAADALASVEAALALLPADNDESYASHDQAVSQAHINAYFEVAMRVGEAMTESAERLTAFVGPCATDADAGNDGPCLDEFVARLGRLAHRAPLGDDEFAFYRGTAYAAGDAVSPVALADLIAVITTSPKFLYRVELGTADFDGTLAAATIAVSDHELAARLSYLAWHSMPDPELLRAADEGVLSTPQGLAEQVDRVFSDPRAPAAFATFFTHWLDLADHPNLAGAAADPAYAALAGDDLPSPELAADMAHEVIASIGYHVWTADDELETWFASPYAFPRTAELAAIYRTDPWDGASEPPLAPDDRAGLLTRPALLAATSVRSRPILRGALIRKRLLCDVLPPPPPDAQGAAGVPDPTDGARGWTEQVTGSTECAGCHELVNPLGFALEGFDSLGRARSEERLFDGDGALLATLPIDTRATLTAGALTADVDGPQDVVDLVLQSGRLHACLAREYFSYAYGRDLAAETADIALVQDLEATLTDGQTMKDFFKSIALHPTFRARGWEAQ